MRSSRLPRLLFEAVLATVLPIVIAHAGAPKRDTPVSAPPSSGGASPVLPPTVPPSADGQPYEYPVGAGDLLSVSIRAGGGESSDLRLRVAGDGTVSVVQVGAVTVAGMTTSQIQTLLERRFREGQIYTSPHVSVNVEEYLSQCVNVAGLVNRQGRYCLKGPTHLLDVLALAEGIKEDDAGDVIRITRRGASEPLRVRRSQLVGADIEAARLANILVQADDNIYVPRKAVFCVLGPVKSPDCYDVEDGMTLLKAISIAGSLDTSANRKDITIKRRSGGKATELHVDLDAIDRGEPAPLIEADDQIVVGEILLVVSVQGCVQEPGDKTWRPGFTITDAIAEAKGSDTDKCLGKLSAVILRRGNDVQTIDVKAIQKGVKPDVELQPGDRILVQKRAM